MISSPATVEPLIFADLELSATQKLVGLYIAHQCKCSSQNQATLSKRQIAYELCTSVNTVAASVRELVARRYIHRTEISGRPSHFRLMFRASQEAKA